MQKNNLSFESENLVVDYITLSVENLHDQKDIKKLARYCFNVLNFNSFLTDWKTKNINEKLYSSSIKNYYILIKTNYWHRTLIEFRGKNAKKFQKSYGLFSVWE